MDKTYKKIVITLENNFGNDKASFNTQYQLDKTGEYSAYNNEEFVSSDLEYNEKLQLEKKMLELCNLIRNYADLSKNRIK